MSFFKLSPNEVERLLQEEKRKRKLERLKQVREQAKARSAKLRQSVEGEKKRLEQVAQNKLKSQWEAEQSKRILKAEDNLKNTFLEIGESHRNALDLNVDLLDEQKTLKDVENHSAALKREREALASMKEEKERQEAKHMQQLLDRHCALDVEKARSAMIASLPKPVPKPVPPEEPQKPKLHLRTHGLANIIIEKENIGYNYPIRTALDEAELLEQKFESLEEKKQRVIQERRQKALLRHKEALVREHQTREQQDIDQDLEDIRKEEIAMKKTEVDKFSKQVLANNLKQKEKAEQEELIAKQVQHKKIEDSKGQTTTDGNSTSELCYNSSLPFDDMSISDCTSDLLSRKVADQKEGSDEDEETAAVPTKSQDTGPTLLDLRHQEEAERPLGFHLDDQARKRLIELVERQKRATSAPGRQTTTVQPIGSKKDAALQTNLGTSLEFSTKKHEAVQVLTEELEGGVDAGSEDWDTSNSYIPSFHSLETPSFDSMLPPDGGDNQVHDMVEIRKRKHELINELKAIDQEMTQMLGDDDDDGDDNNNNNSSMVKLSINNAAAKDQSEEHPEEIHQARHGIFPSICLSLNESLHSSKSSSTQYLNLPPHGLTIGSSKNSSGTGYVMDLYDSETSQITIAEDPSPIKNSTNPLQTNQSPCSSTRTDYHDIPTLGRRSSGNSLPECSFQQFTSICKLPSISSKSCSNSKLLSLNKGPVQPHKGALVGGGDESILVPPNSFGLADVKVQSKFSIENSLASNSPTNLLKYLEPDSSLISQGNSSVISLSERASIISLELQNQEDDNSNLTSNQESQSALNTIISKFIHFYSPRSSDHHEKGSSTSDSRDPFNTSGSSERNLAWLDFLNPLYAMNSAVDINSERASFISVELLDPETESTRLSLKNESATGACKLWKTSTVYHSDHSKSEDSNTINGNKSSSDLNEMNKFDNLIETKNNISNDSIKNQTLNHSPTRNWLKILEPYKEAAPSTIKTAPIEDDDTNDESSICSSASQFHGVGILDEPDLTLASANSTVSMHCDSLQNSGLMSSSLHSFERHEVQFQSSGSILPSEELGTLQATNSTSLLTFQEVNFEKDKTDTSKQKNLMYPGKFEIENNLKEKLDSWKRSRAMAIP